jgi:nitrite reductase/ring-hydroxylating ferredoxin subunit
MMKYPIKLFKNGKLTRIPETDILVVREENNFKVISDICPHLGGPLSEGQFCKKSKTIRCPWHGYQFCLESLSLIENPNEEVWADKFGEKTNKDFQIKKINFYFENESLILN